MADINWIYVLFFLTGVPSIYMLIRIFFEDKSVSSLYFGLALVSFLVGILLGFHPFFEGKYPGEWGNFIAITFALSGLFVKIRNSKPVFARFPMYLTALPLVSILFYPLVLDSLIVKDLIQIIYQGGGIVVAILVLSINQYLYKERGVLLVSSAIFLVAYILNWFIVDFEYSEVISQILFSLGIVAATFGFKRISDSKNNQTSD